ncbi:uncharacterized protein LOC120450884 isoform X1 [Drosophila santomea]|nr:uncharacterized protein LOC120450884 isoform X1 [Drosophila santomea]
MQHVDALSRCTNIMVIQTNSFEDNLVICQGKDTKLKEIRQLLENTENKLYEMRNGIVYKKTNENRLLFYVPIEMEEQVLYKYHNELGHVGRDKMIEAIMKNYWFPNLKQKCSTHISNCLKCISFSPKTGKTEGFLHNIPKGNKPFEIIHIDHYGPVDLARPKKHILVIVDAFTKFVRLYATKTTNTKEVIQSLNDYFRAYSRPKCIISDRGACFTSGDFDSFLKECNVKHIKIATGSPQANGQVERINRSLGPMISKLIEPDQGLHWDLVLEKVEYTLNNTQHRSIKQYPSIMLFGLQQKGQIMDELKEKIEEIGETIEERDLESIRNKGEASQKIAQAYNKEYVDKKRKRSGVFTKGDYVMVKNFDSTTGIAKKLIPKHKGPYVISKVLKNDRFLLEDVDGFQISRNPYRGVWSIQNIKHWQRKIKSLQNRKYNLRNSVQNRKYNLRNSVRNRMYNLRSNCKTKKTNKKKRKPKKCLRPFKSISTEKNKIRNRTLSFKKR